MSSFAARRRERRVERAAPRLTSTHPDRRTAHRWRSVAVAASLAGSVITLSPATSTVLALEPAIVGPAELSSGLQTAERLNPPPPRTRIQPEAQAILDLVNAQRSARGIAPLQYHPQLTEAALAHAADQFNRNCLTTLSHTGTDGSNPGTRIARTGLSVRNWAENVACNQRTAAQVMTAWMNSSGHRENILNPSLTHIGISMTFDSRGHRYWMQVFGTPR